MRRKRAVVVFGLIASILVLVLLFFAVVHENNAKQLGWEQVVSESWRFSAWLPPPVEHNASVVETPYGDAPVESFAGVSGPFRFTIAVAEYDPLVATEFTEEQRYDSAAETTPKLLHGKLVKQSVTHQDGLTGREQIIHVPGKGTLKTRMFLIRNRSYQAQIAIPNEISLDPALEKQFFDSFAIQFSGNPE